MAQSRTADGQSDEKEAGRKEGFIRTHRSHFDPGISFERIHFAFAVAHAAQAAPHFAVGNFGRSSLGMMDVSDRGVVTRQTAPDGSDQIRFNGRPAGQARNKCGFPRRPETRFSDDDKQLKRLLGLQEQDRRRETAFFANSVDDGSGSGSRSRASALGASAAY